MSKQEIVHIVCDRCGVKESFDKKVYGHVSHMTSYTTIPVGKSFDVCNKCSIKLWEFIKEIKTTNLPDPIQCPGCHEFFADPKHKAGTEYVCPCCSNEWIQVPE